MTPEKRQKIQAMLDDKSSTPNEKEICRKLLKENPEDIPRRPSDLFGGGILGGIHFEFNANDFWNQATSNHHITINFHNTEQTFLYSHTCGHCDNFFVDKNEKSVYCVLCLAAKQREADDARQ